MSDDFRQDQDEFRRSEGDLRHLPENRQPTFRWVQKDALQHVVKGRPNIEKKEDTIDETKELKENPRPVLTKKLNIDGVEITEAIKRLEGRFNFIVRVKEIERKLFNQFSTPLREDSENGGEEDDSSEEGDDTFDSSEDDWSENSYEHGDLEFRQDSVVQETCMSASVGVNDREKKYGVNECASVGEDERAYGESTNGNKSDMMENSQTAHAGINKENNGGAHSEKSYEHGPMKNGQNAVVQEKSLSASNKKIYMVYNRETKDGGKEHDTGVIGNNEDDVQENTNGDQTKVKKGELMVSFFSKCAGEKNNHIEKNNHMGTVNEEKMASEIEKMASEIGGPCIPKKLVENDMEKGIKSKACDWKKDHVQDKNSVLQNNSCIGLPLDDPILRVAYDGFLALVNAKPVFCNRKESDFQYLSPICSGTNWVFHVQWGPF
ncbi:hypothetical protein L2E82_16764 [Cichorium intybus]|uniref:Uncharacterized protein n=1 Tax=Cichorium intybus TaxID=13427 RepID=A0ACB9F6F5_CICIN|nr:hypothetical protein L2E82_16764 [Cichorium intybus]